MQRIRPEKVLIPPPQFLIFYNGKDKQPDRQELRLSDLYAVPAEETWLELRAVMLNVNAGHSPGLLEACQTLKEYSLYVDRVRRHAQSCRSRKRWSVRSGNASGRGSWRSFWRRTVRRRGR